MAVLVDTSVWIDLFRGRQAPHITKLKRLLGRQELVLGDLILAEILQGVRTRHESERVESAFRAYSVLPLVLQRELS